MSQTPYTQIRKEFGDHAVRHAEVPGEHAISLPVPTMRWTLPAYAGFAGPAARAPGRPLRLGAPDRWWALHAGTRRLVAYGLTAALPIIEPPPAGQIVVDRSGRTLAEITEELRVLDELMDAAVPAFLDGSAADATIRGDLREALTSTVTPQVLPWYRALAPDFYTWLDQ